MHKCLFKSPLDMYNRFVIRLLVFHSLKFFCRNQRWSDLNRTSNFHGKQYLRLSSPFSISLFLEYFHQEKSTSFLVPMANYSHGDFFPLWNRGSYLQMPNLWWGSLNELSDPFVCHCFSASRPGGWSHPRWLMWRGHRVRLSFLWAFLINPPSPFSSTPAASPCFHSVTEQ